MEVCLCVHIYTCNTYIWNYIHIYGILWVFVIMCVYARSTIPLLTKNYLVFTVSRYCDRHLKRQKKTLFSSL